MNAGNIVTIPPDALLHILATQTTSPGIIASIRPSDALLLTGEATAQTRQELSTVTAARIFGLKTDARALGVDMTDNIIWITDDQWVDLAFRALSVVHW